MAVNASFGDEELQKRFCLLRLAFGRDGFERIGDLGQVGGRGRVRGLDGRG